jgi:hypothetical protein
LAEVTQLRLAAGGKKNAEIKTAQEALLLFM